MGSASVWFFLSIGFHCGLILFKVGKHCPNMVRRASEAVCSASGCPGPASLSQPGSGVNAQDSALSLPPSLFGLEEEPGKNHLHL